MIKKKDRIISSGEWVILCMFGGLLGLIIFNSTSSNALKKEPSYTYFTVGGHNYSLFPSVDSIIVRDNNNSFGNFMRKVDGKKVRVFDRSFKPLCKDVEIIKKMAVSKIDTTYYEKAEYGDYKIWYCDTSFSVKEAYYDIYPKRQPLFPNADSVVRGCKTEIKMELDTTWKEM